MYAHHLLTIVPSLGNDLTGVDSWKEHRRLVKHRPATVKPKQSGMTDKKTSPRLTGSCDRIVDVSFREFLAYNFLLTTPYMLGRVSEKYESESNLQADPR
jgi:hypothetical protein